MPRCRGELRGGLTLTDRWERDGGYNRVISADTRLVFAKLYYSRRNSVKLTRDTERGATRADPIWQLEVDRTGRMFGFNYRIVGIGKDFETQSGFVNRNDIITTSAFNRVSFYGKRGAFAEQFTIFGGGNRIFAYDKGLGERPIEGGTEVNGSLRLRGGWNINGRTDLGFVRFNAAHYAGYTVAAPSQPAPFLPPSGVFDAVSGRLSVSTPQFRQWDGSVTVARGATAIFPEAARGLATQAQASVTVRPTPSIRAFGTLTWTRLDRWADRSEFARTVIPRLKVEVQPTRALFFRVVGEYRSERRAALGGPDGLQLLVNGSAVPATQANRLRVDWLASFEPTPGTVAFFGYGRPSKPTVPFSFQELRRREDGFFVKLAYLFRR